MEQTGHNILYRLLFSLSALPPIPRPYPASGQKFWQAKMGIVARLFRKKGIMISHYLESNNFSFVIRKSK
jgi:hypothetical protein